MTSSANDLNVEVFALMTWIPVTAESRNRPPPADYAEIFDVRGRAYHEAMSRWPQAREREFSQAIELADLQAGQCVCDYPAGGGYLSTFISVPVRLVLLETSRTFLECAGGAAAEQRLLVEGGVMPLADESVDRVISVAGMHHVAHKTAVFREIGRCLKPGGRVVIADVAEGSPVARFLNEFVDAHSEEGHEGLFLNAATSDELAQCGYHVRSGRQVDYPWRFPSHEAMIEYCRLLFGISKAPPQLIAEALESYLGFSSRGGQWELNWALWFLVAEKFTE